MPALTPPQKLLRRLKNPEKAQVLQRFFKTGPGEYAEGDRFLGIMVPGVRKIARQYAAAPKQALERLLASPYHEERLLGLLILVSQFQKVTERQRQKLFSFYLRHSDRINSWDLVDLTAPQIVGAYLEQRPRAILYKLASSASLWERRIAVLATFWFIRQNDFSDILALAAKLLQDDQDLMHKAVGWMLREVGKRNQGVEEQFLKQHYRKMPRTMLRYAIERFPEKRRQAYLKGRV